MNKLNLNCALFLTANILYYITEYLANNGICMDGIKINPIPLFQKCPQDNFQSPDTTLLPTDTSCLESSSINNHFNNYWKNYVLGKISEEKEMVSYLISPSYNN